MRNLNNLATFVQVAKHESVTKASEKLHLTQQAVSYQIKKLEDELGVLLFKRAHRRIYLTQEGRALLKTTEKHLSALEHDIFKVKHDHSTIIGPIKIGTTMELANLILVPVIVSFKKRYPQVNVELVLQDDAATVKNIIHSDADLGVVVFSSEAQLLHITPIKKERFITLASTEFMKEHGPFNSFRDVIDSNIIDYHPDCPSMKTWLNKNDKVMVKYLEIKTASMSANDDRLIKQLVMSHLGIANVPEALFEEELKKGTVVEVLPQAQSITAGIDLISMKGRVLPPQTEAFTDHLKVFFAI